MNPRERRETRYNYNPGLIFDPVHKKIVWPDNKRISTITASLITTEVSTASEEKSTGSSLNAVQPEESKHFEDFSSIPVEPLETSRNSITVTPQSFVEMTEKVDIYFTSSRKSYYPFDVENEEKNTTPFSKSTYSPKDQDNTKQPLNPFQNPPQASTIRPSTQTKQSYYPWFVLKAVLKTSYKLEAMNPPRPAYLVDRESRILVENNSVSKRAKEREYQCLGQWEEKGHIFTYTKRKDIDQFECFVGFRESQGKVILGEAGKNCKREINLQVFGMTLIKKEECKRDVIFEPVRISTTEKTSTENPSKELISDTKGSNSCIHRISNFIILIQIIRYLL